VVDLLVAGGACARLKELRGCARAASLISVRGPLGAGDMMGDGVISPGAMRPLGLSGPSTRSGWRQENAGSRPRLIS